MAILLNAHSITTTEYLSVVIMSVNLTVQSYCATKVVKMVAPLTTFVKQEQPAELRLRHQEVWKSLADHHHCHSEACTRGLTCSPVYIDDWKER